VHTIAITEHHNIDSWEEVAAVAGDYPEVRVVRAAELTVTTSVGNVDLLCYGLPVEPPSALAAVLTEYHDWQRRAGSTLSAGLQALGCDFSDDARRKLLQTYRPERSIAFQGVTHVKNGVLRGYLIEQGWAADEDDYHRLMKQVREQVTPPPYPAVDRVTSAVHEAGGLVAIAHPPQYFLNDDRARMDRLREECALDGIECAHPNVDASLTSLYREYCRTHSLVSTAGSDCHDTTQLEERFAQHGGPAEWLDEFLERIIQR